MSFDAAETELAIGAAAAKGAAVYRVDIASRSVRHLADERRPIDWLEFVDDTRLLAGCSGRSCPTDGVSTVYDLNTGKKAFSVLAPPPVSAESNRGCRASLAENGVSFRGSCQWPAAVDSELTLAVIATRIGVYSFDLPSGVAHAGVKVCKGPSEALDLGARGATLAVLCGDGSLGVWDTKTWTAIFRPPLGDAVGMALSRDGSTLVSVTRRGSLQVWSVKTGKQIGSQRVSGLNRLAIDDAGRLVAWGTRAGDIFALRGDQLFHVTPAVADALNHPGSAQTPTRFTALAARIKPESITGLAFAGDGGLIWATAGGSVLRCGMPCRTPQWIHRTKAQRDGIPAGIVAVAATLDAEKLLLATDTSSVEILRRTDSGSYESERILKHAAVDLRLAGQILVAMNDDGTLRFVNLEHPKQAVTLRVLDEQGSAYAADTAGFVEVLNPKARRYLHCAHEGRLYPLALCGERALVPGVLHGSLSGTFDYRLP